jgi:oxepin-CoA hydrolase/3-oxo-5,6-dehydrosuberyl-CoA semialdehyde dehydrogenase
MPHDGSADDAATIAGLGGGMLVTSVYTDDHDWLRTFVGAGGTHAGRIYIGSSTSVPDAPGSGAAYPHSQHGGPGRAGDGAELGGRLGVGLYLQRVALQGARAVLEITAQARPTG